MANFGLNDTVGILVRILQNHREIIRLWHEISALLTRVGLMPAGAQPARAMHAFDVEWVQESLNAVGGANIEVDGRIGPATTAAVTKYQEKKGLEPDGWIGMLTLAALEEDMLGRAQGPNAPR